MSRFLTTDQRNTTDYNASEIKLVKQLAIT